MTWNVSFADNAELTGDAGFSDSAAFECSVEPVVHVSENDHTRLSNRDAPDQHPMGAITGLDTSLEAKVSAGDALTNLELETLLGGM